MSPSLTFDSINPLALGPPEGGTPNRVLPFETPWLAAKSERRFPLMMLGMHWFGRLDEEKAEVLLDVRAGK